MAPTAWPDQSHGTHACVERKVRSQSECTRMSHCGLQSQRVWEAHGTERDPVQGALGCDTVGYSRTGGVGRRMAQRGTRYRLHRDSRNKSPSAGGSRMPLRTPSADRIMTGNSSRLSYTSHLRMNHLCKQFNKYPIPNMGSSHQTRGPSKSRLRSPLCSSLTSLTQRQANVTPYFSHHRSPHRHPQGHRQRRRLHLQRPHQPHTVDQHLIT